MWTSARSTCCLQTDGSWADGAAFGARIMPTGLSPRGDPFASQNSQNQRPWSRSGRPACRSDGRSVAFGRSVALPRSTAQTQGRALVERIPNALLKHFHRTSEGETGRPLDGAYASWMAAYVQQTPAWHEMPAGERKQRVNRAKRSPLRGHRSGRRFAGCVLLGPILTKPAWRIVAVAAPRMAASQPVQRQDEAFDRPVALEGFYGVG